MVQSAAMRTLESLSLKATLLHPCAVTIGSFDGVHLGHQSLIRYMRQLTGPNGAICVVTFSSHPSHILPGRDPVTPMLDSKHKLFWLNHFGVDCTYSIPFSLELAALSYVEFLDHLHTVCEFDHLVLGKRARLGNQRKGTPELIARHCTSFGATAHFVEKVLKDGEDISSSRIRALLKSGKTQEAEMLLGHPISIEAT